MSSQWERRRGFRNGNGERIWTAWSECAEAEAKRVTGLHSWEVRRPMAERLDALMERCRDGHVPTYQDLLTVKGTT
jgi:hypothetical protein